ncbi:SrfA family protein [Buttiauxella izardii]|uniref:Virulence factor n=1 Tax=Buttiauxella izardii TaxID=82991 RepID=A0A3A5JXF5_9ENTR|nr:SrfA family protein [Buttiauxella izardii]RJT27701.1 hypothetical protein D6029_01935 [Buttiauxella izardii]
MRNSIQGPLLRTGNNSSFKALGETGYPVFKMAFQLREAIYRLDAGRDLARHLAIPQNDQGGDRTDWYSSFSGDVIPWSGASETERASARQQFNEFQIAVQALSEQLLNADQSGTGGDRRVFAQLLKSVVHFPDYDFVYLVNGVLVITFWGFIHPSGELSNPMHWLEPSSIPVQTPLAATTQPVTQAEVHLASVDRPVVTTNIHARRWKWRWFLWLLLGLLLLALLLGLLRGCTPSLPLAGLPGLSGDKTPALSPNHVGNSTVSDLSTTTPSDLNVPKLTSENGEVISSSGNVQTVTGQTTDITPTTGSALDTNIPVSDIQQPVKPAIPVVENRQSPQSAVAPNTTTQGIPSQGEPLTFPPTLPNGPAQFLNGQWRVNGGIQDKLTGRPLQLQYNFEQGTGSVSVRQSSGVTCQGPATGNMQQGALSISNPEQMKCSDGSNFIVPNIECKSPASGHADCVGSNDGDKSFPIRMLQPNS